MTTHVPPGFAFSANYCFVAGAEPSAIDLSSLATTAGSTVLLAGVYGMYTFLPEWLATEAAVNNFVSDLEQLTNTVSCVACAASSWFPEPVTILGPATGPDCKYAKQFSRMVKSVKGSRTTAKFMDVAKGLGMNERAVDRVLSDGYVTLEQVQKLVSDSKFVVLYELNAIQTHTCPSCVLLEYAVA